VISLFLLDVIMKIYLGVPYSDPDPAVKQKRFEQVTDKTGELMQQGHIVYSPITACHPVAVRCDLPGSWEYWGALDRTFIDWCEEVWILKLDGWEDSTGLKAEVEIAREMGKPVRYIEKEE
jgi:hypothetical protein